jgi:hypothetical protein
MDAAQHAFVKAVPFQMTLGAVVQRGGVYEENLPETNRRPVHRMLREMLESLFTRYSASRSRTSGT